jgi:hypothetical protein
LVVVHNPDKIWRSYGIRHCAGLAQGHGKVTVRPSVLFVCTKLRKLVHYPKIDTTHATSLSKEPLYYLVVTSKACLLTVEQDEPPRLPP